MRVKGRGFPDIAAHFPAGFDRNWARQAIIRPRRAQNLPYGGPTKNLRMAVDFSRCRTSSWSDALAIG
jgi:hypothetical protein